VSAGRILASLGLPLALLLVGAPGAPEATVNAKLEAGVFDPPRAAPAFRLEGSDGRPLELGRYRGKVVILGFGFSSCTDVCPVTLSTLAQARRKLGADAAGLQVVYVTVDPARDDARRLREYLAAFDPSFLGGTGTPEQLAAVRELYGIASTPQAREFGHGFAHSSFTYLIDRRGRLRALMPYGAAPETYVHDVRILLAE
jgi:protein SCO1/2